jgi:hypothetical protein
VLRSILGYPAPVRPTPSKTSTSVGGAAAGTVATVVITAVLEAGRRLSPSARIGRHGPSPADARRRSWSVPQVQPASQPAIPHRSGHQYPGVAVEQLPRRFAAREALLPPGRRPRADGSGFRPNCGERRLAGALGQPHGRVVRRHSEIARVLEVDVEEVLECLQAQLTAYCLSLGYVDGERRARDGARGSRRLWLRRAVLRSTPLTTREARSARGARPSPGVERSGGPLARGH